ncbi:MAG TPA: response regulator [Thalassobaculum sp.]
MATILVIDDEPSLRDVARLALEGAGHTVTEAPDGRAAMAALDRMLPDLIITDILMPEQEGLQTIREIRKRWKSVPVLAMSGGGRTARLDFLQIAKGLGANATLTKPFRVRDLLAAVDQLLRPGGA